MTMPVPRPLPPPPPKRPRPLVVTCTSTTEVDTWLYRAASALACWSATGSTVLLVTGATATVRGDVVAPVSTSAAVPPPRLPASIARPTRQVTSQTGRRRGAASGGALWAGASWDSAPALDGGSG